MKLRITNYDGTAKTLRSPSNRQVIYCLDYRLALFVIRNS